MDISIKTEDGRMLVTIIGRVDTTNAVEFQESLRPLMELDNPDIEIDCRALEYTSSQGLRVFLMLQKAVSSKSGTLVLKDMQPQVKEVFDITGFSSIIKIR